MSVLIAYASTHGHTGRIARRIGEVLEADGIAAEVRELSPNGPWPTPDAHEAVVVGASLHAGRHQKQVERWLREHREEIDARPNALFSVSLSAAEEETRGDATRCVEELTEECDWAPDHVATFGGALQYREYDVFTRLLMRLIARHHGASTDTSADVDLTDWDEVERFAHHVALQVRVLPAPKPVP